MANKKTHEQFVKEVYELESDNYTVIGTYIDNKTKIEIQHNECGNKYFVTPAKFKQGRRCPKCNKFSPIKKTTNDVQNKLGDEYIVKGEYINTNTPILIKHTKCNREYSATPNNILNKNRKCPYCTGRYALGLDEFKKRVFEKEQNNYIVIDTTYINDKTKITMLHSKCKNEFKVRPNDFLFKDSRCPYCNESKGEKCIEQYLTENNIEFEIQYKFETCKDINPLPFDFIVYYKGHKFLIEYDGEQHYFPIFGDEKFIKTKYHDEIKTKWCNDNNIKLLRIKYTDFKNINEILEKYLETFND